MKTLLMATAAAALLLSQTLFAGEREPTAQELKKMERDCQEWAKFDGLEGDELGKYIAGCVKDLRAEFTENSQDETTEQPHGEHQHKMD